MEAYSNLNEATQALKGILQVDTGPLTVLNEQRFRLEAVDPLVYTAVFGDNDTKEAARWMLWEAAAQLGVFSAPILDLYEARGRGDVSTGFTVPAMNLRALTYDSGRAAIRAAMRHNVGPFVFEIAKSEMGYTDQRPAEYATVLIAAALREGFRGPLFIQGDHFQVNRKRWEKDPAAEIDGLRKLIAEAISAGFYNIDIDSSTLVDLSQPTVYAQQQNNFATAAELTAYLRSQEPQGISVSVGGEIGEVGGKNSTPEELDAFMAGYVATLKDRGRDLKGISKISVQTGTEHGGVVLPDGRIAQVALDFNVLKTLSNRARGEYGMAGAVQHGASTLPDDAFHKFVESDCCEVHLATAFQNLILEHPGFPSDLRDEMYAYLNREHSDERKPGMTDEQFIYKTRKNAMGPFKRQLWNMAEDVKSQLCGALEQKFAFYYQQLSVVDTRDLVDRWIKPAQVSRPRPKQLQEVG